ncbi:hypothetical protein [Franconibacter pulveris]|uniref:hypothetical protein n=1 Tax=Franconibacter pulveris TaxID=435910 RepID=UPI000496F07D|nr:hypothetical protein [Franconibacter pulveris]
MKPIHYVFIWLLELLSLSVIYSLLCYVMPDESLFLWYEERYGMVMENQWYDAYTLILMLVAIFINCVLIWLIVAACNKKKLT